MRTPIQIGALLLGLLSCGQTDVQERGDETEPTCAEERQEIGAALDSLNYCTQDQDCMTTGLHPHYGCYFFHHKDADTLSIEERVDAYSTGSCWDGSTTLLDCAPADALVCKAGKCTPVQ